MKHASVGAGLVALWIVLWGDLTLANVVGGALAAAVVLLAAPLPRPLRGELDFHPLQLVVFAAFFLRELVEASLVVAATVVRRQARVRSGIVAVPLVSDSDALTTLVGNAVSLTPGTLTLEVQRQPAVLYIHVLHLTDVERVRSDVATLERRIVRAFGSRSANARLAETRPGRTP